MGNATGTTALIKDTQVCNRLANEIWGQEKPDAGAAFTAAYRLLARGCVEGASSMEFNPETDAGLAKAIRSAGRSGRNLEWHGVRPIGIPVSVFGMKDRSGQTVVRFVNEVFRPSGFAVVLGKNDLGREAFYVVGVQFPTNGGALAFKSLQAFLNSDSAVGVKSEVVDTSATVAVPTAAADKPNKHDSVFASAE